MDNDRSAIQQYAYHQLAAAVLVNACKQASKGDLDAFVWLALEGPEWAEGLGFDGRAVRGWLLGDLSVPTKRFWAGR